MRPKKTAAGRDAAASRPRTLRFEYLEERLLLTVSAAEQLFVYLLNQARHDPVAYQRAAALAVDLSGIPPRPPLAVNDRLMQSAGMRSEEMAEHDYFAHYSPVSGAWPNKLARDQSYPLPSSWPDDTNYIESLAAGDWYDQAAVPLDALIVDQGLAAATHRRHLLGADGFYAANREIGVGYATNPDSTYGNYWSVHIARQENASVFLTGVVFADRSGNGRYDMGEGLPGVTVQAGGLVTTSNDAGGFSVALSPNRQYRVLASGPGLSAPVTTNVYLADANVEVDIVSGVSGAYLDFADQPTSAWTNPRHRLDVSGNQVVDPVDALQIINHLNTIGAGQLSLPDASVEVQPPFLDTDADGQVLPHDVLLVINDLNRPSNSGEGEGIAGVKTVLPISSNRPAASVSTADVQNAVTPLGFAGERRDARQAACFPPAFPTSSHERALSNAWASRFARRDSALDELQEELAAAWLTSDLLKWGQIGVGWEIPVWC